MDAAATSEPISPELALVCPELRARAIAALGERESLQSREPLRARALAPEYALMRALAEADEEEQEWVAPLPVAIAAYAATSAVKLAIEAAAVIGLLVVALSIMSAVHS